MKSAWYAGYFEQLKGTAQQLPGYSNLAAWLRLQNQHKNLMSHPPINKQPQFTYEVYTAAPNKKQYLLELILAVLHKNRLNPKMMCLNELNSVIVELKIILKARQLHELYLFSTYDRAPRHKQGTKIATSVVNQEKKAVNLFSVAEWLQKKFQAKEITAEQKKNRAVSQHHRRPFAGKKLSPLKDTVASEKLQDSLRQLIDVFESMEKERQNSGLIPINEDQDENMVQIPAISIPYDPQLHELNNRLCQLKLTAEEKLLKIVQLAKSDVFIKKKLEQAIQKFQTERIEANEKVGRFGALNAQRRVNNRKYEQIRRYQKLDLSHEELFRATQVRALLMLPQKRKSFYN